MEGLEGLQVIGRKVIVERQDDGTFLTMDQDGQVRAFGTVQEITRWIDQRDARTLRKYDRAKQSAAVATVIEWRRMPEGWTPPNARRS